MSDLAGVHWQWLRRPRHRDWALWTGIALGVLYWVVLTVGLAPDLGTVLVMAPLAVGITTASFILGVGFVRQVRAAFGRGPFARSTTTPQARQADPPP